MLRVLNTLILFTTLTLSFFRQGLENYSRISEWESLNNTSENSFSFSSSEKPDYFYLPPQRLISVSPAANQTFHLISYYTNKISVGGLSAEIKIVSTFLEYLYFSETISRSLSISDIVFPFHYFW
jgi:hypothetical protein